MTIYVARKDINIMSTGFIRTKGSYIEEKQIPDEIREAMIEEGVLVSLDDHEAYEGAPVDAPEVEKVAESSYSDLSKDQLKELCAERGLKVGGTVSQLIERLEEYDAEDAPDEAPEEDEE